jgi:hypothetical protein
MVIARLRKQIAGNTETHKTRQWQTKQAGGQHNRQDLDLNTEFARNLTKY